MNTNQQSTKLADTSLSIEKESMENSCIFEIAANNGVIFARTNKKSIAKRFIENYYYTHGVLLSVVKIPSGAHLQTQPGKYYPYPATYLKKHKLLNRFDGWIWFADSAPSETVESIIKQVYLPFKIDSIKEI